MRNELVWKGAIESVNEEEIRRIEDFFNVKLPPDYLECARKNHGRRPVPSTFDMPSEERQVFNLLLSFSEENYNYILEFYEAIQDRLVDGIYPFADDPFGNFICFDYRKGKELPPTVVFWDHERAFDSPEKAITPICNSFTELLAMLHDSESEID